MNPSYITPTPYPEAVELLEDWVLGVPDTQCLEIRSLKKVGRASKKFGRLSGLSQVGCETALAGYLGGRENVCYGVAPRYEPRRAEPNTDRGDAVNLATTQWLDEISRPATDLPPFSWMVEASVGRRCADVATGPSPQLLPEPDCEMNGGESREGMPECTSTPAQPSTQIPCTLTQGSGTGVSYSTERNTSTATGGGGCYGQT